MVVTEHLNIAVVLCWYRSILGEPQSKEDVRFWPAAFLAEARRSPPKLARREEQARRIAARLGISVAVAT